MKKYLILISIIAVALYASTTFAWMNVVNIGGGVGPSGDSIDYLLLWNGDDCTGNSRRDAKGTGGACADETGTLTGATIITTDESNYYLDLDAADERLIFDLSGGDWDPKEFYIRVIAKVSDVSNENNIMEIYQDATNSFEVFAYGEEIWVYYTGGGTTIRNYLDDNSCEQPQDGYYFVLEFKVSDSANVFSGRICSTVGADCLVCSGSEPWDTTVDVGTATPTFVGDGTSFRVGELNMGTISDDVHVTEIEARTYANAP
jgi:hypothetical protein